MAMSVKPAPEVNRVVKISKHIFNQQSQDLRRKFINRPRRTTKIAGISKIF
jgi:hypothetical protein